MHTLRIRLKTTDADRRKIEKRFRQMNRVHNQLVSHCMKALSRLKHCSEFQEARRRYGPAKRKAEAAEAALKDAKDKGKKRQLRKELREAEKALKAVTDILNACTIREGLTKTQLEKYAAVMQKKVSRHLSSHQVQAEVSCVLKGVHSVLYGKGKQMHFRRLDNMDTIHGKSTYNGAKLTYASEADENGEIIRAGMVCWNGLQLPLDIPHMKSRDADYFDRSISARLKYCEIKRMIFPSGWHYYAVLVLDGPAPKKTEHGEGITGIDPGVSSCAAVWQNGCLLEELAPKASEYDRQISLLTRAMERSRRASNPQNYNADGTVVKGKKKWAFSHRYLKLKRQRQTLFRRKSGYVKQSHEELANRIIRVSAAVKIESMRFSALAKRSAKTERQEKVSVIKRADGRTAAVRKYKRKKRFGSSVNRRSPGLFVRILKRKCREYSVSFEEVSTAKLKASQYRHDTDSYVKCTLKERFHMVAGQKVQRDLYSAFIIACSDKSEPDRALMTELFPAFADSSSELISAMKADGISMPQVFGW